MPTDAELVDVVRQAIFDIVSGKVQSVTIGQTTFTRLDLDKLRALKREFETNVSRETYGDQALISLTGPGR